MGWNIKNMLKQSDNPQLEITNISIHDIIPHENNFYAVKDTANIKKQNEQLIASIELFGLMTPILVRKENEKYKIISGHRRWYCCKTIYDEGNNNLSVLPCIIDDGKGGTTAEEMKLILANSTTRRKTDYELTEEISRLKKAIIEYKESGHKLPCRVQDIIAETTGLSKSTVGRHESIDKNLIDDAKKGYKQGDISMSTAAEMASMSADEQKAVYDETNGKPKLNDVKQKAKESKDIAQPSLAELEQQGQETMFNKHAPTTTPAPIRTFNTEFDVYTAAGSKKDNVSFGINRNENNQLYSYITIYGKHYTVDLNMICNHVKECIKSGAKL